MMNNYHFPQGPVEINQNQEESMQESREAMQLQMIQEQQKISEEVIELIQAMAKQMEDGQEKSDQRFDELQKQITEINDWRAQQCCSKMCTVSWDPHMTLIWTDICAI